MRILAIVFFALALSASAMAQQELKPGSAAPAFAGELLDGKPINLSDLQGKIVVMTFWSTRCAICHSEIPKLNQVADRYKGKDVVFLALTMENQVKVEPYLKRNPFNFNIMPNSFGVVLKYADMDNKGNIDMGFPSYFLINQKGAIALKSSGWDKWSNLDSQISKLLIAN